MKLSKTGAEALADMKGNAATSSLLQDYNETPSFQATRTPRTPAQQDNLLTEAQNILALTQTASVLEVGRLCVGRKSKEERAGPLLFVL